MSGERDDAFWLPNEHKLATFERKWYKEVVSEDKRDYTMSGELSSAEKVVGNHLVLAGPMVDGYLKEMGKSFLAKLTRGSLTGLAPPISLYLPPQVLRYFASLCTSYGAEIKVISKTGKNKKGKMFLFICKSCTADSIFSPSRFDGTNYLVKRHFQKKLNIETGKLEQAYAGHAKVAVSNYTPIRFEYNYNTNQIRINFYIQRYTDEGFVVDASIQQLMNQELYDKS
jgi:hypothetical protein